MPFYTRVFSALPLTFARSTPLIAEFDRIVAGFAAIEAGTSAEVTTARQGQASLTANLGRYLNTFAAAPGALSMGGFKVASLGAATASTDAVNLAQLQAFAFSSALPAVAGNVGKVVRVNAGPTPAWDNWWGAPVALTVASNGATLSANTTYHLDSSGGAFSVSLPTMATNDWVKFLDVAGQLGASNVTVLSNGNGNFRDGDTTLILDVASDSLELVKTSTGVKEQ